MKLVVLCGGSGTRLWPVSRTSHPKQFAKLFENRSLYELTLERNKDLVDGFIIVVNEKQLALCLEQLSSEIKNKTQFIIEPIARNTAPAITLAALLAPKEDLLIVPSDHLIQDLEIYKKCVLDAQKLSQNKKLVTFGLKPRHPETGFGYIEADGNTVLSFKEKPDFETAKKYVEAGNYFWNSGMFFFNSEFYISELKNHQPEILKQSEFTLNNANEANHIYSLKKEDMATIPADSIDYAIMEKSQNVGVIPSDFSWTDLGSFDALFDILPQDENNNTLDENFISLNSHNNLIISGKKIITTFDVEDLIIVDTPDALLIGKRGESQKVKNLLERVKSKHPHLLD